MRDLDGSLYNSRWHAFTRWPHLSQLLYARAVEIGNVKCKITLPWIPVSSVEVTYMHYESRWNELTSPWNIGNRKKQSSVQHETSTSVQPRRICVHQSQTSFLPTNYRRLLIATNHWRRLIDIEVENKQASYLLHFSAKITVHNKHNVEFSLWILYETVQF